MADRCRPKRSPGLGCRRLWAVLQTGEAVAGKNAVVVLSDRFWRIEIRCGSTCVGRTLQIGGRTHDVIGVAPASFYFPDRDALLWTPYVMPTTTDGSMRICPRSLD